VARNHGTRIPRRKPWNFAEEKLKQLKQRENDPIVGRDDPNGRGRLSRGFGWRVPWIQRVYRFIHGGEAEAGNAFHEIGLYQHEPQTPMNHGKIN
jgi:hypothetical protein